MMCPHSFSATADTIDELIHLARVHIKDMQEAHDKNHRPKEGSYPETNDEILRSPWFGWTVSDLVPFTRLAQACERIPRIPA